MLFAMIWGFMNPCLDYTLVILDALKQAGFETTLIIEELKDPNYGHNRVHFAVEFSDNHKKRYIEFSTFNKVVLGIGDYKNSKEGIERMGLITISGNYIGPDKNILRILGITSLDEADRLFDGFSFALQLALLRKSNSDRTYNAYLRRLGDRKHLHLEMPYSNS